MTFHELLFQRRSTRKFLPDKIEPDKIEILKKTALLSPTGKGKNHWEFIFIQSVEMLHTLAASKQHGSKLIEGAALAVVVIGNPAQSDTWIEDCSIASILLQMQAEELSLGSCWVQIHKRPHNAEKSAEQFVKEQLNIPADKNVLSIIAIGYPKEKRTPIDESELLYHKIHLEKF